MSNEAKPLKVHPAVRCALERWIRASNVPQQVVLRARIVLGAADGLSNSELASQLGTSRPTVIDWRRRFAEAPGVTTLLRLHPGRKTLPPEKIAAIVRDTLRSTPPNGIRWTTRALARAQGVSHSSVFRIWKERGLQIHGCEAFKVRDIAGLYLKSLENAVVAFIVDNDGQAQAPDDTRSRAELRIFVRRPHDRHRVSDRGLSVSQVLRELLYLELGSAEPLQQQLLEILTFLGQLHQDREMHVVALKTAASTHPSIREWFSARRRYHLHYAPASAWFEIVEHWLTEISYVESPNRAARNVRDLLDEIANYVEKGGREFPFAWWAPPLGRFQRRRPGGPPPGLVFLTALFEQLLTKAQARK